MYSQYQLFWFFISPLPLKPYEINAVRGNRKTANEQNRRMTQRLQNDPQVIEQVKEEMKSLQDAGFIVKLSELPLEEQERLNADFKHYIPTTIALKKHLLVPNVGYAGTVQEVQVKQVLLTPYY